MVSAGAILISACMVAFGDASPPTKGTPSQAEIQKHFPKALKAAGLNGLGLEGKNATEIMHALEKLRLNMTTRFGGIGMHSMGMDSHKDTSIWEAASPVLVPILSVFALAACGALCWVLSDEYKQVSRHSAHAGSNGPQLSATHSPPPAPAHARAHTRVCVHAHTHTHTALTVLHCANLHSAVEAGAAGLHEDGHARARQLSSSTSAAGGGGACIKPIDPTRRPGAARRALHDPSASAAQPRYRLPPRSATRRVYESVTHA